MPNSTITRSAGPNQHAALGVAFSLGVLYIVWGSTYLAIKVAVDTIPPYSMLAFRFLVAGGLLYLYLLFRGAPNPTLAEWLGSVRIGSLLLVGGMGSVTLAESMGVSSGVAAVVVSTMPLWFAFFARFWGERISLSEWSGMILGLSGVVILNAETNLSANPAAAALLFLAPISWALGSVWSRSLLQPSGLMASAAQMLTAGAVFIPIALLRGESMMQMPSLSSSVALVYLITFGSLLAYSAYVYLLSRSVRPAVLSSYAYVNPVVAVLLGVGLAGESLTFGGLMGVGIILLGVVLAVMTKAKGESKQTTLQE